jgi:selenocysteine lyase/cysteine desulfurase
MDISDYSPAADARRFDAGTPPVPNIYGGLAGMSIVEEAGARAVEEHIAGLTTQLIDGLDELGAVVATPREPARRGPLVAVKSTDVETLVDTLSAARIICSERDSNLRIALHLYNVDEDIDAILAALARHRHLLA